MKKLIFFFSFFSILLAGDFSILLNKIEKNDDLSNKTRMESSGISYVITRYQLDAMQAKTLGDILDNTAIGYLESRYGIVDPYSISYLPYNSVGVRVFIDNQEIASGEYDNTLYLFGKLDLSFVDHIEIYYMSPTYSLSNEPAYIIIKLYTKDAKRDEGQKIAASYGSFKSNKEVYDWAKSGNYSLYLHLSRLEWNHKKYKIKSSTLNRNSITKNFLFTVYNQNTRYLFTAINYRQHAFLGLSLDGNIKHSMITSNLIHFGVDTKQNKFTLKYSIDYGTDKSFFEENDGGFLFFSTQNNIPIKKVDTNDYTLINTLNGFYKDRKHKNEYIIGAGYRNKIIDFYHIKINGSKIAYNGPNQENVYTAYAEDNYQYLKNAVFTVGFSGFQYFVKTGDKFLKQYKIGNTYLADKNNIFKFFYHHMEFMNANYLVSTLLPVDKIRPRISDIYIGKYKKIVKNDTYEINVLYSQNKNWIIPTTDGLTVYKKSIPVRIYDFKYHHNYDEINDFVVEFSRMFFGDTALKSNEYLILMNTHRYKKFQFFENLVYKMEKFTNDIKTGINVNFAAKYDVNDNLTLGFKAYNILNRRYGNDYFLINFQNNSMNFIRLPLYERSIDFNVEYLF